MSDFAERPLTERKRKRLCTWIEKLDFERAVLNLAFLTNQLVKTVPGNYAAPLLIGVHTMIALRRCSLSAAGPLS